MAKMDKEAEDYDARWTPQQIRSSSICKVNLHFLNQAPLQNYFRVAFESDFVAEIRKEEIAVCQDEANQQHYEVQIFWDPEEWLKKAMITK